MGTCQYFLGLFLCIGGVSDTYSRLRYVLIHIFLLCTVFYYLYCHAVLFSHASLHIILILFYVSLRYPDIFIDILRVMKSSLSSSYPCLYLWKTFTLSFLGITGMLSLANNHGVENFYLETVKWLQRLLVTTTLPPALVSHVCPI